MSTAIQSYCGKTCYLRQQDAEQAAAALQALDARQGRRPAQRNVYRCSKCQGAFHVGRRQPRRPLSP
jgi:hypothetical protein